MSLRKGKTYVELYGFVHAKEIREKIRESLEGRVSTLKGKTYEEIFGEEEARKLKKKRSEAIKGIKRSDEFKRNISLRQTGISSGMKGKHHSDGTKVKMRKAQEGEKSRRWLGGISKLPYPFEFGEELKYKIRDRDSDICVFCGEKRGEKRKLDVHHIDYDKKNCSEENLITLCNSCHMKTNFDRPKWEFLFTVLNHYKQKEV